MQVRGTEPRLTNLTIDGINVPSPENNARQIKLDAIPADIVESVEINKTLQANQDADGIGGSAWAELRCVRPQSHQRSLRLLPGQPPVHDSARILPADIRGRFTLVAAAREVDELHEIRGGAFAVPPRAFPFEGTSLKKYI